MGTVTPITKTELEERRRASLPTGLSTNALRQRAVNRMRYAITQLVEDNQERVEIWLDTIAAVDGAKAALDSYLKLLEFALPKLSRAEVSVEDDRGNEKVAELTLEELQNIVRDARTIESTCDDFSDLV